MDINHLPYEIIYIILSKLSCSELSTIRGTCRLFMIIADDIVYSRQPVIERPISFYNMYKKQVPILKIYAINYNILRILAHMPILSYDR